MAMRKEPSRIASRDAERRFRSPPIVWRPCERSIIARSANRSAGGAQGKCEAFAINRGSPRLVRVRAALRVAIAVTRRETNGWKWPFFMLAYLSAMSYIFAGITHWSAVALGL
jgi:hypothetical protein